MKNGLSNRMRGRQNHNHQHDAGEQHQPKPNSLGVEMSLVRVSNALNISFSRIKSCNRVENVGAPTLSKSKEESSKSSASEPSGRSPQQFDNWAPQIVNRGHLRQSGQYGRRRCAVSRHYYLDQSDDDVGTSLSVEVRSLSKSFSIPTKRFSPAFEFLVLARIVDFCSVVIELQIPAAVDRKILEVITSQVTRSIFDQRLDIFQFVCIVFPFSPLLDDLTPKCAHRTFYGRGGAASPFISTLQ